METKTFVPKWPVMVSLAGPFMVVFGVFASVSYFQTQPEDRNILMLMGTVLIAAVGVYGPLVTVQRVDVAYDRFVVYRRLGRREIAYSDVTDVSPSGVRARRGGFQIGLVTNAAEFGEILQGLVSSGRINPYQLDGKWRIEEARTPIMFIGGLVIGVPLWLGLTGLGVFSTLEPEWTKHSLEACVLVGMAVMATYFWLRDRFAVS